MRSSAWTLANGQVSGDRMILYMSAGSRKLVGNDRDRHFAGRVHTG